MAFKHICKRNILIQLRNMDYLLIEIENNTDVFQGTLLRRTLNIYWQDKVSNVELYHSAGMTEWNREIKKRCLKWLEHLLRLPEETPAIRAGFKV